MRLSKYTIPKGRHARIGPRRLFHRWLPRPVRSGSSLSFEFTVLTEPYDIRPDPDQDDHSKLIGCPIKVLSKTNKNAALVSFRPMPDEGGTVRTGFGWSVSDGGLVP